MKPIHRVKKLYQAVETAQKEIARLQKRGNHLILIHRTFPDIYCGMGGSTVCLECGKGISSFSMHPPDEWDGKKHRRIENKRKEKRE